MILTGGAIREMIDAGAITFEPYDPSAVGQVSIDYHLGPELRACVGHDVTGQKRWVDIDFPDEGLWLEPDVFYLGHTLETIGSEDFLPHLDGRDSLAALSLEVHIDANLGHPTAIHQWTLEISCVEPVYVKPGMVIGQVWFEMVRGPITPYTGKHAQHSGAQASLSHLDEPQR